MSFGSETETFVEIAGRGPSLSRLNHPAFLNCNLEVILALREQRSRGMSLQELRAGIGLLLAVALIIGWSLGIGLPLAAVIIWFFS